MTNEEFVLIGGGTGIATLVKQLKHLCENIDAIVSVTDDGSDTGWLRRVYGIQAVGDLRNVLTAFIPEENMRQIAFMSRRYAGTRRSAGNRFLWRLLSRCGNLEYAMETAEKICGLAPGHHVLPVTLDNAHLWAQLEDGKIIHNEGHLDRREDDGKRIVAVGLTPSATLAPKAARAIENADKVIFAPGSRIGSIYANLCVDGMKQALRDTRAQIVHVVNIMTTARESEGMTATDHVREICQYLGRPLDVVICNNGKISPQAFTPYYNQGQEIVEVHIRSLKDWARKVIADDFVEEIYEDGIPKGVRHNHKLATHLAGLESTQRIPNISYAEVDLALK